MLNTWLKIALSIVIITPLVALIALSNPSDMKNTTTGLSPHIAQKSSEIDHINNNKFSAYSKEEKNTVLGVQFSSSARETMSPETYFVIGIYVGVALVLALFGINWFINKESPRGPKKIYFKKKVH